MGNGNDTQNNNTQNNNTQNNNTQNNNTRNSNPQGSGPGNNQIKKKGKFSGLGDGIKNSSAFKELGKTALIALIGVIILATVSGGFYTGKRRCHYVRKCDQNGHRGPVF